MGLAVQANSCMQAYASSFGSPNLRGTLMFSGGTPTTDNVPYYAPYCMSYAAVGQHSLRQALPQSGTKACHVLTSSSWLLLTSCSCCHVHIDLGKVN